jgi:hypothetical protein
MGGLRQQNAPDNRPSATYLNNRSGIKTLEKYLRDHNELIKDISSMDKSTKNGTGGCVRSEVAQTAHPPSLADRFQYSEFERGMAHAAIMSAREQEAIRRTADERIHSHK